MGLPRNNDLQPTDRGIASCTPSAEPNIGTALNTLLNPTVCYRGGGIPVTALLARARARTLLVYERIHRGSQVWLMFQTPPRELKQIFDSGTTIATNSKRSKLQSVPLTVPPALEGVVQSGRPVRSARQQQPPVDGRTRHHDCGNRPGFFGCTSVVKAGRIRVFVAFIERVVKRNEGGR